MKKENKLTTLIKRIIKEEIESAESFELEIPIESFDYTNPPYILNKIDTAAFNKIKTTIEKLHNMRERAEDTGKITPKSYYDGVNKLENFIIKSLNSVGVKVTAGEGDDDTIILISDKYLGDIESDKSDLSSADVFIADIKKTADFKYHSIVPRPKKKSVVLWFKTDDDVKTAYRILLKKYSDVSLKALGGPPELKRPGGVSMYCVEILVPSKYNKK